MGREEIKNQIKSIPGSDTSVFGVVTLSSLEMLISVICWVTGKAATGIFLFEFKQTFFKMLRVLLGEIVSCQFNIYILFVAWSNPFSSREFIVSWQHGTLLYPPRHLTQFTTLSTLTWKSKICLIYYTTLNNSLDLSEFPCLISESYYCVSPGYFIPLLRDNK